MKKRIVITVHADLESQDKVDALANLLVKDLTERLPNLIDVNKDLLRIAPKVKVDFSVTQPSGY